MAAQRSNQDSVPASSESGYNRRPSSQKLSYGAEHRKYDPKAITTS
jgi:hypothetical protein